MDNMEIYNKARVVPNEAKKEITAGRLKGFTDINPMWRIKKLTEVFGPAGFGWWTQNVRYDFVPAEETKEPDAGVVIPAEEDDDDLPYSVSNEDLRAAVKDARAKVGSQPIWNLFHKYGINASIDCPDEKRPQFYAELKSLAA